MSAAALAILLVASPYYALAGGLALLLVVIGLTHHRFLRLGVLLLASAPVYNPDLLHLSKNLRLAALVPVVLLWAAKRQPLLRQRRGSLCLATLIFVGIGLGLAPFSIRPLRSLADLGGLLVVVLIATILVSQSNTEQLRRSLSDFCTVIIMASTVVAMAHLSGTSVGGRWSGVLVSPNSLGLVAALALVAGRPWTRTWWIIVVISGGCLLESGSRAAALGAVPAFALIVLQRFPLARRAILVLLIITSVPLLFSALTSHEQTQVQTNLGPLFRTDNSRTATWHAAVQVVEASPSHGQGAGNEQGQAASGLLLAAEELGLWAVIPLGFFFLDGVRIFRQREFVLKPLYIVLFIEGLFESWLFDSGSPFFLLFLVLSIGLAVERISGPTRNALSPRGNHLIPVLRGESTYPQRYALLGSDSRNPPTAIDVDWGEIGALPLSAPSPEHSGLQASLTRLGLLSSFRRGAVILFDQALSSFQNYIVLFSALHGFGLVHLSEFMIAYTAIPLLLGLGRGFLLEPFTIRFTRAEPSLRHRATAEVAGATVVVGLTVLLVTIVSSTLIPSRSIRDLALAFGIAAPIMLLQDAWRVCLIADGRPLRALVNDGCCLLATIALVGLLHSSLGGRPWLLLLLWTGGSLTGAVLGIAQLGVLPRVQSSLKWFRKQQHLGVHLGVARLATSTVSLLSYYLVILVVSVEALGRLSAGIAIFAPITTVISSVTIFAAPEAARYYGKSAEALHRFLIWTATALALGVLSFSITIWLLPQGVSEFLAGGNWRAARSLLLPISVWMIASAVQAIPGIGLRVQERSRTVLIVSVLIGITVVSTIVTAGLTFGLDGVVWGYAGVYAAANVVWWTIYERKAGGGHGASDAELRIEDFSNLPGL